jgi:hypothetical protein
MLPAEAHHGCMRISKLQAVIFSRGMSLSLFLSVEERSLNAHVSSPLAYILPPESRTTGFAATPGA